MNLTDDLQKLYNLREQGALTEEEFTLAKKCLLDGEPAPAQPKAATPREPSVLNQLRRSLHDKWFGGVCGGLAEMTGIPTWAWRILFVLMACLEGVGILLYILLWIFVPLEKPAPQPAAAPKP